MSNLRPVNDCLKVKLDADKYGFGPEQVGAETGVVVEVPETLLYLSFHSFAFEDSFMADELRQVREFYANLQGKRIYWESFQDRGRKLKEGDDEYVFLKMTDVLAYSDNVDDIATTVEDTRSGAFKV